MRLARFQILLLLAIAGALGACDSRFHSSRAMLESAHETGAFQAAAEVLDDPQTLSAYGERNKLLYWLERGSVALANGRDAEAVDSLNKADDYMEVLRKPTTGDEIGRWLLNDTAAPYYASSFEDMYINVLKLLAHLQAGRVAAVADPLAPAEQQALGAASIEARRLASKSDFLRDRYVRAADALKRTNDYAAARAALGDRVEFSQDNQFVESPLGTYLSAVTFMKSGEPSLQEVAGRRLQSALDLQWATQSRVDRTDFAGLGSMQARDANVLFVAFSGRAPTKQPERFGPVPIYTYTLYFEVPRLVPHPSRANSVRVTVERAGAADADAPAQAPVLSQDLSLVENLGAVAQQHFDRELPGIITRTILRSSAKAAAWAVGTEAARRATRKKESAQAAVEIAGIIGGLLFVTQTEKADLRSWLFLPAQAHVGLARLEPGTYRARLDYLSSSGGTLYSGPWRTFDVKPGERALSTVLEQWWN